MFDILGNSYLNATRQSGYVPSHNELLKMELAEDVAKPRGLAMIRRWRRRATDTAKG